ncbi:hypothetical protein TURU_112075 [Turdus rufiventris]|nr:hypothetical protein TURU_112075 [Turdus rufiventris]
MGVTTWGPSPSVRKALPNVDPIHFRPPVGHSPITQLTSSPDVMGTRSDLGQDQKEAVLASTAIHHPAVSVRPKKSRPASKRSPSPSEDENSDSSDSHPKSKDCWAKTQRETNREGDWKLASNITAFLIIHKKGKRALAYTSWKPLPYEELKDFCKAAKEHSRSLFYFKNLLEATFSAHTLVPHNIKNIVHCLLTPAESMLWKKHLIALSVAYSKKANRPNFTIEQLTRESNFQKPTD